MKKILTLFQLITVTFNLAACSNSVRNTNHKESLSTMFETPSKETESLPPTFKSPVSEPTLFEMDHKLYLYMPTTNHITIISDLAFDKESVQISPDRSLFAFPVGPNQMMISKVAIVDAKGFPLVTVDITKTLRKADETSGIIDVRWIDNHTLLVGLMYNSYYWGYFRYDITKKAFITTEPLYTRYGTKNLSALNSEHLLYIPPYERPFNQHLTPKLVLDDNEVLELKGPEAQIGEIVTDPELHQFAVPIREENRQELLISGYDLDKKVLLNPKRYPLALSIKEVVEEVVFDFSQRTGFLISVVNSESRKLFAIRLDEAPVLKKLADLENDLAIRRLVIVNGEIVIEDTKGTRNQMINGQLQMLPDPEHQKKTFLLELVREKFPDQVASSTDWSHIHNLQTLIKAE